MSSGSRYRNVCFTWNNPSPGDEVVFDETKMKYLTYQLEKGENGTLHFQGYVEFTNPRGLNSVKTLLGCNHIHIERRRGTSRQAADYCQKDDTRVEDTEFFEYGELSSQGERNDLESFKDAVKAGKRKRDLVEEHFGTLARYPRFYDTLTSLCRPKREKDLEVVLHIGGTGLGKTRLVMDTHGDSDELFLAPLSNGVSWYDGYDGHKTVLLDDFAGAASHMSLASLLRLLDRYPQQVPIKGGFVWWLPDKIYVTTNILPCDWYKWEKREEQYRALERRFTSVFLFYPKLHSEDLGYVLQDRTWWKENAPSEALKLY